MHRVANLNDIYVSNDNFFLFLPSELSLSSASEKLKIGVTYHCKSPPTTVGAKGGALYGIMRGMPAPGVGNLP